MALKNPIMQRPFRALILGSSGSIGGAFQALLERHPLCESVQGIHRKSSIAIDYLNTNSIEIAAKNLAQEKPFQLIINTIGVLHTENWMPEKRLEDLTADKLQQIFQINAIGPALTLRSFSKLLDPQGAIFATLSAKVGSIEDNRLGGWYGYRASKAALNMFIKTAAIEIARTNPQAAIIAMHPGTVQSKLSAPFRGMEIGRPAIQAADEMLNVLETASCRDSGKFFSYSGEILPW